MTQPATKQQKRQSITRANHVLPVCHQQSFTNPNGELFVQFLNREKPPISLHPTRVGVVNDFYTRTIDGVDDDGIERFFANFVEGDYATVAKRATEEKNEFVFDRDGLFAVLRFVVTQLVRTEAHRRCINVQAGIKVSQDTFIHNMHRKMHMISDQWIAQTPEITLWTPLPCLGVKFITGDNPVVCFTNAGDTSPVQTLVPPEPKIISLSVSLASSHNGFIVPLTPYLCLTILNSVKRDSVKLRPPVFAEPV
jgi:hypothetical protein